MFVNRVKTALNVTKVQHAKCRMTRTALLGRARITVVARTWSTFSTCSARWNRAPLISSPVPNHFDIRHSPCLKTRVDPHFEPLLESAPHRNPLADSRRHDRSLFDPPGRHRAAHG